LSFRIFYDNVEFRIKNWRKVKKLIAKVISEEEKISGDLNFIITDDDSLKEINIQFLKHNYFTDVISFGDEEYGVLSGEIYISLDRVKENANNYNVSLKLELLRVIIHGTLHLCGYEDQTERDKLRMQKREDFWLNAYNNGM
jgi:probable rRNA maturation factor